MSKTDTPEPNKNHHNEDVTEHASHLAKQMADKTSPSTTSKKVRAGGTAIDRIQRWVHSYLTWAKTHKRISIPTAAVVLLGLLAIVPPTRYALAGLVVQKDVQFEITDSRTGSKVLGASVLLDGKNLEYTDKQGTIVVRGVKPGKRTIQISAKNYAEYRKSFTVGVFNSAATQQTLQLVATGRVVRFSVRNKITNSPAKDVHVKVAEAESIIDDTGYGSLVVQPDAKTISVQTYGGAYNIANTDITLGDDGKVYELAVVPKGKVYFLSRQSGKIDVVKTNLDGSERQTILAGTGKEDEGNTTMLATRDWKYLALLSRRDDTTKPAKLYLIDTTTDKSIVMDEGDADFSLIGWSDHTFAYHVARRNKKHYDAKVKAIKTYIAESRSIKVVVENAGTGDANHNAYETIGWNILDDSTLSYFTYWQEYNSCYFCNNQTEGLLKDKRNQLVQYNMATGDKKLVKEYTMTDAQAKPYSQPLYSNSAILYEPKEIFFSVFERDDFKSSYYKLAEGKVAEDVEASDFFTGQKTYPTYLVSPSGKQTIWSDVRDGKTVLLRGDADASNETVLARLTGFSVYGWYTDEYLLVTKEGSELYIMPAAGLADGKEPLKVADYHKPNISYKGYGGGYGGF